MRYRQHTLTNSERSVYQRCLLRWFFQYGLGLSLLVVNKRLDFGSLWHDILRAHYNFRGDLDLTQKHIDRELDKARKRCPSISDEVDVENHFAKVSNMIKRYKIIGHWTHLNELHISAPLQTPDGRQSPWLRYGGAPDKVVDIRAIFSGSGDVYKVAEHKTSSQDLELWARNNAYKPQTLGYAWLVQAAFPDWTIDGVIYDLASTKLMPIEWHQWPVVGRGSAKDPKRLAKKIPSGATAEVLAQAIERNGFTPVDQPYYMEFFNKLTEEPPKFFHQVHIPIDQQEVIRIGVELYHLCKAVRRKVLKTHALWHYVREDTPNTRQRIVDVIRANRAHYPRGSQCITYNRMCSYHDLCRYGSCESLEKFYLRDNYHPEV